MKAKLLKEQMGVPAGTKLEVLETGRAWTLKAPSGAEIVVPSCDVEMVPDTEPFSEPKPEVDLGSTMEYGTGSGYLPPPEPEVDPKKPLLLVADEYQELLDEQRNSEVDPKDPSLLVNIFGGQPQPVESEGPIDTETDPAVRDEDGNVVMDEPETYDFSQDPEPTEDEEPLEPHFSTAPSDDDLDEPLPEPQGDCDGEACESCQ